ncbi:SNARE complex subunit (Vam7), putative [Cordyceps militaris CM01]|uniref:SNARE complex subunit (Vam7), putative n=2 Tax=Cordyceps militaris TaxID=73501 RepID=G3JBS5_CORMM|nr:SNARE complex subunit (Vam7), putative [Cordyceps militaris CM01]ATY60883.1 SNARE complex subunit (Vam7) [Cordyceps militaris]EGX94498.1 SNARE complex subunit (Vam7), putative [Cordyceps militaris CM01]
MAPPPEIAIPSTSISDEGSGKPYTLYNITLRLPLRSFVVQKRYSDFGKLHETLLQQVGSAPPQPLPQKHWLKSTVTSPDLARERQVGLERYLKTIAESPDRRWRDTPAWRAFLNLPNSSTTNSAVSAGGRASNVASGAADPATWLDLHKELKQHLHDARIALSKRDGAADSGNMTAVAEAAASARKSIVRGGTLVVILTEGLKKLQESGRIGDGELRRRRDLVSTAKMEREGLDKLANSMPSSVLGGSSARGDGLSMSPEKAKLLNSARPGGRRLGGGAPASETDKTRELDNQGVLLLQKQEMEAQDLQLDQLTAIIRRQKEMGLQINEEVERQTQMLDVLDEDEARVRGKLGVANNRIRKM